MNWTYTTRSGRLTVTEYPSGFEVRDNNTGGTLSMGDGIDMFEDVIVSTPEFFELLRRDIERIEQVIIDLIN